VAARKPFRPAPLEKALGYKFKDKELLRRALTHASVRAGTHQGDNERLEFLGDRVLGLVMAEAIWRDDGDANEGALARRYNSLVRRETCAIVARAINLGGYLFLSEAEAQNGGREKDTILSDAIEAVLGAIFIDGGFERARSVVTALWAEPFEGGVSMTRDPKSALQEWAQGNGLPLPRYKEQSRSGPDHAPEFVYEVRVKGLEPVEGRGASKRLAEQDAAQAMLEIVRPSTRSAEPETE
jgi:ribonuclease-3